jgi:hypothetical protein
VLVTVLEASTAGAASGKKVTRISKGRVPVPREAGKGSRRAEGPPGHPLFVHSTMASGMVIRRRRVIDVLSNGR